MRGNREKKRDRGTEREGRGGEEGGRGCLYRRRVGRDREQGKGPGDHLALARKGGRLEWAELVS